MAVTDTARWRDESKLIRIEPDIKENKLFLKKKINKNEEEKPKSKEEFKNDKF